MVIYFSNGFSRSNNGGAIILNKKYLLYGYGITNQSVERFFKKHQVKYIIGIDDEQFDLTEIDVIIKSPGIPFNTKILEEAKKLNILVISDLELFSLLYPHAELIIVTGTNGKTSIVLMIASLLENLNIKIAGNMGIPIFDLESEHNFINEIIIIEASSYMLANTYTLHPHMVVLSNLFPNHLDHHLSVDHYFQSKIKALQNMNSQDLLITTEDLKNSQLISYFNINKIFINSCNEELLSLENNNLYYHKNFLISNFKEKFPGIHNFLNWKMAIVVAERYNVSIDDIKYALENFHLPEYRLEKVLENEQVIIYNDSKSTNILALLKAFESLKDFKKNIYWIGGGLNRQENWAAIEPYVNNLSWVGLYGENRQQISQYIPNAVLKKTLEEVIQILPSEFSHQTIILFSPGSPSTDQFENFEKRGELFNKLIIDKYISGKNNC